MSAYDGCWIFGDAFCSRSFKQYFQQRKSADYNGYIKAHFDTVGYYNNTFSSDNPSLISRMANLMSHAMASQIGGWLQPLPKLIIVVPDNDIIRLFEEFEGISKPLSCILNYIMTEHERCIGSFKEMLPAKSLKADYPQILWLHAPQHDNFANNSQRFKFNKCLDEVSKLHSNVSTFMFKKVWDPKNGNFYLKESGRFTADGLRAYWETADRTARYFDSVILKKCEKRKNLNKSFNAGSATYDRFRWQKAEYNVDSNVVRPFKKLPTPPPLRF